MIGAPLHYDLGEEASTSYLLINWSQVRPLPSEPKSLKKNQMYKQKTTSVGISPFGRIHHGVITVRTIKRGARLRFGPPILLKPSRLQLRRTPA